METVNTVTLGVVQFACTDHADENVATASRLVREAAGRGANIVLVQELFDGHYFCQRQNPAHFARARELDGHPTLRAMQALAAELGVVIPVSLFERHNQLDHQIANMGTQDAGTMHAAIEALKKEKLHVKDELYALLRQEAAAAG